MKYFKIVLIVAVLLSIINANAQTTVIDSIFHEGVWRNYRVFLPSNFSTAASLPLVFNFHGYGSNALEQELYSGFNTIAEAENVVVCHPNGINNSWNVITRSPDDIGFVDTMITILNNQYNINLNRVYSTGLSNGGFLSNFLACELSNKIAAIAPVAGTNVSTIQADCHPSRKVPVLHIHGDADMIVLYDGASSYASVADLMDLWKTNNGCTTTDTFLLPDISTTDFSRAERITWHNCDSNRQVIHYRIIDGGHTWPGAAIPIGVTNQDMIASQVIWDFFNQYALNPGIDEVINRNQVKVEQNPFQDIISIRFPNFSKSTIQLFTIEGKLVHSGYYSGETININSDHFKPGTYFLRVYFDNLIETTRLVKM
jgi:polyhydroxybutyrate depolymerase